MYPFRTSSVSPPDDGLPAYGDSVCAALGHMGVGAAEVSTDGKVIAANRRFWDVTGLEAGAIGGTSLSALLGGADLAVGTEAGGPIDRSIKRPDGSSAWIRISMGPVRHPATGAVTTHLLIVSDVTPRKAVEQRLGETSVATRGRREVGGRLINALEAEKGRIARELHDDIGQSLAVLVIQMLRAGKPISGTAGRTHADIPELAARLQEVAARVGRLSHELHSSRLEYLGLERTIRSTCADFSKAHPMAVDLDCEGVSAEIESGIGLCVLRVVQESLHNAAKHSRAARVKVELRGSSEELSVAIADDGVGFDVVEASMAEGIGLISMRERLAFVGGTFAVTSSPGQGTRVEARVPLAAGPR